MRRVVRDDGQAHPLNSREAADAHARLDELDEETEPEVADHEQLEAIADGRRQPRADPEDHPEHREKNDFV